MAKRNKESSLFKTSKSSILFSSQRLYQQKAISAIIETFKEKDRAHVVMACASGKSRVGLWVTEALQAKTVVVFVPSLALVKQLMQEWLSTKTTENVSCLAICSDETVIKGVDSFVLNPIECDFPVTTDVKSVKDFLKADFHGVKWIFCTYHSSAILCQAAKGLPEIGLAIFDEAHRTTGKTLFNLAIKNKNIRITKRLFMTATPKHYDIIHKNNNEEAKLVFSMDDETLYGPRAFTYSFRQAIQDKTIADYKVVISISELKHSKEHSIALKMHALEKAALKVNANKIITFHANVEDAQHLTLHVNRHQNKYRFKALHINGMMPISERESILDTFKKERGLLTNARCLTEGVDVPCIDMVGFFSKKRSTIDIVQAIGRALRTQPGKTHGYIFLPLFVEVNQGEAIEEAVERADFNAIWEVIQAMVEQDELLQKKLIEFRENKALNKTTDLSQYIEIISHEDKDLSLNHKLKSKISALVVDRTTTNFDEMFGYLKLYMKNYNHCNVPCRFIFKGVKLGIWAVAQRVEYRNGTLSQDRIKRLQDIGFVWDVLENQWDIYFSLLKKYRKSKGHCNVPIRFSFKGVKLGSWAIIQRNAFNNGTLSKERIKKLEDIGFVWGVHENQWDINFSLLKEYKKSHGHCNVPIKFSFKGVKLGSWAQNLRKAFNNGKLSKDRIKKLEDVGFVWDVLENQWDINFSLLEEYKKSHGDCNVSYKYTVEGFKLRQWVRSQRKAFKNGALSRERIKKLEDIGFVWDLR